MPSETVTVTIGPDKHGRRMFGTPHLVAKWGVIVNPKLLSTQGETLNPKASRPKPVKAQSKM